MASRWDTVELGTVATVKSGYAFKSRDWTDAGVPVVKIANVKSGRLDMDGCSFITEPLAASVPEAELKPNDILIAMTGYIGDTALVSHDDLPAMLNQRVGRFGIKDHAQLDWRYFFFVLRSDDVRSAIEGLGYGSAQPNVSPKLIHSVQIPLPPLPVQQRIADVLGKLDDKIELNRRMNWTLEKMAAAIFKSWFIDFLPVRAKMAAKQQDESLPACASHADGLLPQAETNTWFVYALECDDGSFYIGQAEDLRQRWLQHTAGKGGRWTKAHPPQRVAYWERQPSREAAVEREKWLKTGFGRKWLKREIACLCDGRQAAIARTQTGDPVHAKAEGRLPASAGQAGDPNLPAEIADLFPDTFEDSDVGPIPKGWDVKPLDEIADYLNGLACQKHPPVEGQKSLPVIKIRELRQGITNNTDRASVDVPPKYIVEDGDVLFSWSGSLLVSIWSGGRGVLNQHVFKVTSASFPKWYFYQATKHHLDEFQRIASDKATTMGHIKRHHLTDAKMAIPGEELTAKGTEVLGTMLDRRINALKQARILALTRDTLLPKLLSGEIELPEAEAIAEEVAP